MKIIQLPSAKSLLADTQKWVLDLLDKAGLSEAFDIESTDEGFTLTGRRFGQRAEFKLLKNFGWAEVRLKSGGGQSMASFKLKENGEVELSPPGFEKEREEAVFKKVWGTLLPTDALSRCRQEFLAALPRVESHPLTRKAGFKEKVEEAFPGMSNHLLTDVQDLNEREVRVLYSPKADRQVILTIERDFFEVTFRSEDTVFARMDLLGTGWTEMSEQAMADLRETLCVRDFEDDDFEEDDYGDEE